MPDPTLLASQWTKDDMYKELSTFSTLCKWDVMVAYELAFVNTQLANSAADAKYKDTVSKEETVTWTNPANPRTGAKAETCTFKYQLGMPTMQFKGGKGEPQAIISMPVTGPYTSHVDGAPDVTSKAPAGLGLTFTADLKHVASDNVITAKGLSANAPITLDPAKADSTHVALDFSNADPNFNEITWPSIDADWGPKALTKIKTHLQGCGIVYKLVGAKSTTTDKTVLNPTSVCFTVYQPSEDAVKSGKQACLLMWMSVNGNGMGDLDRTDKALRFRGNNDLPDVCPVPSTHNAAVFFSQACVWRTMLEPNLKDFIELQRDTKLANGIHFTAKLPDKELELKGIDVTLEQSDQFTYQKVSSETVKFHTSPAGDNKDYKDAPLATFSILDTGSCMSWQKEVDNIHFTYRYNDKYRAREGQQSGYAKITVYMDELTTKWENNAKDEISLRLTMQNALKTKDLKKGSGDDFWSFMSRFSDDTLPKALLGSSSKFGALEFSAGISYFVATNLLFSDATVFEPDLSAGNGVSLPYDMFLLGSKKPPPKPTPFVEPSLLVTGSVARSLNVQKLLGALLEDENKFAMKLNAAMAAYDSLSDTDTIHDVLKTRGLENITADELSVVTRFKEVNPITPPVSGAYTTTITATARGHHAHHNGIHAMYADATIDLKEFAAVYRISKPVALAGRLMAVNPHTGAIAIQNRDNSIASATSLVVTADSNTWPLATFTCTVDSATYNFTNVKFTTDLDTSTNDFTLNFSGTLSPDANSEGFVGSKAQAPKDTSSFDKFTIGATIYGFITATLFGGITVLFGIQAWYWHSKDKKAGHDAARDAANATEMETQHYNILKRSVESVKSDLKEVKDGVAKMAQIEGEKITSQPRLNHIRKQLENDLADTFKTHTANLDMAELDPATLADSANVYKLDLLEANMETRAQLSLQSALESDRATVIDNILKPYEVSGVMTATEKTAMRKAVVKAVAESMLNALKADTAAGTPSYMASHTRGLLATKIKADAIRAKNNAAHNASVQATAKTKAQNKLNADTVQLQQANAKLAVARDAATKRLLQQQIHTLKTDIANETTNVNNATTKEAAEQQTEHESIQREHEATKEEGTSKSESDSAFKEFEGV